MLKMGIHTFLFPLARNIHSFTEKYHIPTQRTDQKQYIYNTFIDISIEKQKQTDKYEDRKKHLVRISCNYHVLLGEDFCISQGSSDDQFSQFNPRPKNQKPQRQEMKPVVDR